MLYSSRDTGFISVNSELIIKPNLVQRGRRFIVKNDEIASEGCLKLNLDGERAHYKI